MAPNGEVLTSWSAWVNTARGRQCVNKGEPLPDDVLEGEAEYLRKQGALGAPAAPAGDDSGDEVDALAASLTEEALTDYVRDHNVKEIVAAVGEDSALAAKVLAAEKDATHGEPRKSLVAALNEVIGAPAGDDSGDE